MKSVSSLYFSEIKPMLIIIMFIIGIMIGFFLGAIIVATRLRQKLEFLFNELDRELGNKSREFCDGVAFTYKVIFRTLYKRGENENHK